MARPLATTPSAELLVKAQAVKGRSLLADARRRLFRNKAAVVSMILLGIITVLAVCSRRSSRPMLSATRITT